MAGPLPPTPELRSALQQAEDAHTVAQAELNMLKERARRAEAGGATAAARAEAEERRKQRAAAAAAAAADVRRLHDRLAGIDQARANVALQVRLATQRALLAAWRATARSSCDGTAC